MKCYAWNRDETIVLAIQFENGNLAVSTSAVWKFETPNEALAVGKRVKKYCGKNYERNHFPWSHTNVKTGKKTIHFFHENGSGF